MVTRLVRSVDNPAVQMVCDAPICARQVKWAPRLLVPNRNADRPELPPLRIMTTLHYCDLHRDSFDVVSYWTELVKRRCEVRARELHGSDFKPDFEQASIQLVLVTTPEYRAFLQAQGINAVA